VERPTRIGDRKAWRCRCDCGKIVDVAQTHLIEGATFGDRNRTHGMSTPIYKSFHAEAPPGQDRANKVPGVTADVPGRPAPRIPVDAGSVRYLGHERGPGCLILLIYLTF
jgi:hypothetical protein